MNSYDDISLFGKCPLTTAQAVISGKWKLMVAYHISIGNNRFGLIKKNLPDCSATILAKQLRELENDGIIERTVFQEVPPHVEYTLTQIGEELVGVIRSLAGWGKHYISEVCMPEAKSV